MRTAMRALGQLGGGLVLAPQRYAGDEDDAGSTRIGDVATIGAEPAPVGAVGHLVDTTDVEAGLVRGEVAVRGPGRAGSVKRVLLPGDVVISRLRPYLRQIALIDDALPSPLLGSSELYVLRPRTPGEDLAFLVPWLLSPRVQRRLAEGVEGGHHPRFRAELLLRLPLPPSSRAARARTSASLREAIALRRASERLLQGL